MLIDRRPWSALAPSRVQLAADGAWQDALPVPPAGPDARTAAWLAAHPGDVALEVFFTEDLFLGVRFTALAAPDRERFVRALCAALDGTTLGFARAFWRLPGGAPLLPTAPPLALEAGVVDAWDEHAPAVLWRRGEPAPDLSRLTPPLREPHPTRVALEAAYANGTWIGRSVSAPSAGGYVLDEAELARAAADFLR
ncbi:hypothetical protein [Actinomadura parmotrematis]|uniref:GNAT family N-acetyltransferase n=1 Tax=Actinomadura parmotrematis TaxID=2864039 RepID=A0ABS7FZA4_9ACTN|nr:hypothetical protein [Actinomadura parmotrematis]MBW8484763.1 hypothetical protein [Actinomadura parmotrematis]